jgi:sec-independent protein translocase protein TatA
MGEIFLLIILLLLFFGPKRLPEVGRAAGNALREFRAGLNGMKNGETDSGARAQGNAEDGDNGGTKRV